MKKIMETLSGLGILGILLFLGVCLAVVLCYISGVEYGFHHGLVLGFVSLIPPIGFFEGLLHLLGVLV